MRLWRILANIFPSEDESSGIISTAIANAEKTPITPSRGQENVSLLQQQASKKTSPASTQFTFTCDSQVPATVPWPGPNTSLNMHQSPAALRKMSTQGTQTSPSIPHDRSLPSVVAQAKMGLSAAQNAPKPPTPQPAPPKKPRRRPSKEYRIAARQRRQQQEYQNYHHPPNPEDIWICEFCEYERIFGEPPLALIRQYEAKDRRARKQEADRRRLLEKAKMKGRKGKKGNKGTAKTTPATPDRHASNQVAQNHASANNSQSQSQGTQSEEFFDGEYDDDYVQDDLPNSLGLQPPVQGKEDVPMPGGYPKSPNGHVGPGTNGGLIT